MQRPQSESVLQTFRQKTSVFRRNYNLLNSNAVVQLSDDLIKGNVVI